MDMAFILERASTLIQLQDNLKRQFWWIYKDALKLMILERALLLFESIWLKDNYQVQSCLLR